MERQGMHLRPALAALVALVLVLGACGTDDNTADDAAPAPGADQQGAGPEVDCAAGSISGAGATFPQTLVQQWVKDYGAACPGATVNYQGVGSGAGIQQFIAGTVDFGASDAVMKPDEQAAAEARGGRVLHIPWTAGGVAVMFNLPGVRELRLRPEVLAGIFAGTIARWDDPTLAADNEGAKLPSTGIQVVHRSDGSGTTNTFTSFLAAAAPSVWTAGAGKDVAWPTGQGAKGSDGVTAVVKQTQGAIGYAEVSFARSNSLGVAKVQNAAGQYVGPTAEGVAAALQAARTPPDLKVEVDYTPDQPGAYPISTTTWALVFERQPDPAKAKLVKSFLLYALGPGQAAAPGLFYSRLPRELLTRAQTAVYGIQA